MGAAIVLVLVVAAVSVAIGVVRTAGTTPAKGEQIAGSSALAEPPAVYVHVFGAVQRPGLYRLADDARVVDLIAAAGGLTPDADANAVNLARRVADGEQVRVPVVGESPPADATAGMDAEGRVNLNTADAAALDTLPRIGPAIAERIIQWRDEHGRFTSVDDLLSVPGIGDKMIASLRDLVTV